MLSREQTVGGGGRGLVKPGVLFVERYCHAEREAKRDPISNATWRQGAGKRAKYEVNAPLHNGLIGEDDQGIADGRDAVSDQGAVPLNWREGQSFGRHARKREAPIVVPGEGLAYPTPASSPPCELERLRVNASASYSRRNTAAEPTGQGRGVPLSSSKNFGSYADRAHRPLWRERLDARRG